MYMYIHVLNRHLQIELLSSATVTDYSIPVLCVVFALIQICCCQYMGEDQNVVLCGGKQDNMMRVLSTTGDGGVSGIRPPYAHTRVGLRDRDRQMEGERGTGIGEGEGGGVIAPSLMEFHRKPFCWFISYQCFVGCVPSSSSLPPPLPPPPSPPAPSLL